jgi:hypothetical protein
VLKSILVSIVTGPNGEVAAAVDADPISRNDAVAKIAAEARTIFAIGDPSIPAKGGDLLGLMF